MNEKWKKILGVVIVLNFSVVSILYLVTLYLYPQYNIYYGGASIGHLIFGVISVAVFTTFIITTISKDRKKMRRIYQDFKE